MNLSGKIKKIRVENKLTQEQLAEKLQVSRSTISSWETGRSYPDLEMVIVICDCFNVSLDFLLREDEEMVRKLNFGMKQKRILIGLVFILAALLINTLVSTTSFQANMKNLEITNINLIRDVSYNGENPYKDWNTTINLDMKSKNIFFKPVANELLVFNDNGNLTIQANWSFSIFNIFDTQRTVQADQSVLINSDVSNDAITLKLRGDKSDKSIPFQVSNIINLSKN
ncbi:helix-turn-helix transcriptional regulator [Lysinibacillus louembei]|uniref:Helix-turn-helix transcriptional regulator n=1 Tax=Lysinibacillus louembei TaxID=1470088 RepID=A0ABZ0RRC5_9BACI|nr:helix-turn-helix transcriptional regulator [Lysinibacillus louembei]WPK10680.1 helix-turn-helix transcriptional regulator [Lysinibacillus louembei]